MFLPKNGKCSWTQDILTCKLDVISFCKWEYRNFNFYNYVDVLICNTSRQAPSGQFTTKCNVGIAKNEIIIATLNCRK